MPGFLSSLFSKAPVEIRTNEKSDHNEKIMTTDVVNIVLSFVDSLAMMKACPRICRQWYGCVSNRILSLDLTNQVMNNNKIKSLSVHPFSPNITTLILDGINLDKKGLKIICSGWTNNVTTLSLADNKIGRKLSLIANCSSLSKVTDLNLKGNEIDSVAIEALCASSYLTKLEKLNLENNMLHITGLRIICRCSNMKTLTDLNVANIDNIIPFSLFQPQSILAIAASDYLPDFASVVSKSENMSNLTRLKISGLDDGDIELLRKSEHLSKLKELVVV